VGKQAKVLKNHACCVPAETPELLFAVLEDIRAIYADTASCGVDQAEQHSNQRGLSAAGEAHDDKELAPGYTERDVSDRHHVSRFFQNGLFGFKTNVRIEDFSSFFAKDLPQAIDLYADFTCLICLIIIFQLLCLSISGQP